MSDFLAALDAEIADLVRQLEAHPLYVKLQDARRLRERYSPPRATARVVRDPAQSSSGYTRSRPTSGVAAIVYDAAIKRLRGRAEPTPIRDLMDFLAEHDIDPGGAEPRNTVSSLLSRYKDVFVSHGRAGWTLAESEKAGDDAPEKDASPASVSTSTPVEPGGEVAHDDILDNPKLGSWA